MLKCSHSFNLLDARGVISVTERGAYIWRVRALAAKCARAYLETIQPQPWSPPVPDLLLEVGCEELPSSACREIVEQAPGLYAAALEALGLEGGAVSVSVAPRRFAIHGAGLPAELAASSRTVRGPAASAAFGPDGAPTKAAEGFARGQGLAVADLVVRDDGGRDFVFAEIAQPGRPLDELVPEIAARIVNGLRFSKTMRWGAGTGLRFSRPVRWIVAKLDDRTVPFDLHDLRAGDLSQGHRFLGAPATIATAGAYGETLRGAAVIASHDERRATILAGLDAAAAAAGGTWSDPGGKLEEVLFLVEWPSVITGRFDERHLRLPARVLVTAMQGHQRYFPLRDAAGELLPAFLAVSNGDPAHAAIITRGNEGVLDARLQDAEFSFDKDLEAGLAALDARLDAIVFHKSLGTMADKRDRLVASVADLAVRLGVDDRDPCRGRARRPPRQGRPGRGARGRVLGARGLRRRRVRPARGHRRRASPRRSRSSTCPRARARRCRPRAPGPCSPPPRRSTTSSAPSRSTRPRPDRRTPTACAAPRSGSSGSRSSAGWDLDPCAAGHGVAYELLAVAGRRAVASRSTRRSSGSCAFLADRLAYLLGEEGVGAEAVAAALGTRPGGRHAGPRAGRAPSMQARTRRRASRRPGPPAPA